MNIFPTDGIRLWGIFLAMHFSGQNQLIIHFVRAGSLAEQIQQLFHRQILLFFTGNIHHDMTVVHHNQPISVSNGITHIVQLKQQNKQFTNMKQEL